MTNTILVTGFDPFGGESINPAWEAVRRLPDAIGEYAVRSLMVPTVFGKAAEITLNAANALSPAAVVCVGQAGGRAGITPEMVAINLRYAPIPDNKGNRPLDEPVIANGPAAYFATLPVRDMALRMNQAGISSSVSYSAGAYVCNDLMYAVLHRFAGTGVKAGFIHVPYLPQQAREGVPSMPLETITRGLTLALEALTCPN